MALVFTITWKVKNNGEISEKFGIQLTCQVWAYLQFQKKNFPNVSFLESNLIISSSKRAQETMAF